MSNYKKERKIDREGEEVAKGIEYAISSLFSSSFFAANLWFECALCAFAVQNSSSMFFHIRRFSVIMVLTGFEFSLLNCLFNRIQEQPIKPFIVKGLFCPNHRLKDQFKLIFAAFTNIPVGKVKIITSRYGLLDRMLTYIAGKGFHDILL
jgi:hypothetical protein